MRHNLFVAAASLIVPALGKSVFWPPVYNNVTSDVEILSDPANLDGFKMNASAMVSGAFDFWYFDVASESTDAGLNIVSFNTGDLKHSQGNEQPLAMHLSGKCYVTYSTGSTKSTFVAFTITTIPFVIGSGERKFTNGTEFFVQTLATEGAFIKNDECGVSADFKGAGTSFVGTNLHKDDVSYTITFDGSAGGLEGTITFKSRAPAHFPCDTKDVAGATQNLLPYLFWANAIPDAESVVDLTIDGEPYKSPTNWGQKSVVTSPKYWDWGHARVGPYAIVWYDLLDYNDTENNYAYVAKDGEEPFVGCGGDTVHARQWGPANMTYTYSPTNKLGMLANQGLLIDYELASGEKLHFNITTTSIIKAETGNVYCRGVGDVEGGVVGGIIYSGRAFYEEFVYGLLV